MLLKGGKTLSLKHLSVLSFFMYRRKKMNTYPYFNVLNPQPSVDRINEQINQLENMKKQMQQPVAPPTNLTQNFQIAPTNHEVIKYANSMEEVQRDLVLGDTPYFSKDMSVVWVKNTKGDIKTYELTEIIPQDEKDIQIEILKARISDLERKVIDEPSNEYATEPVEDEEPSSVSAIRKPKKK